MKTTVDIPDNVLEEALQHSHASSHAEALLAALTEYNRRHRAAEALKTDVSVRSASKNDKLAAALEEDEV